MRAQKIRIVGGSLTSNPGQFLLDHIDIIVSSSRRAGGRSSLLGSVSSRCGFVVVSTCTTPVIFHLLIQFLLGLAGTGVGATVGWLGAATTSACIAARRACGTLTWNVTVDVIRGGLGDITAVTTTAAATTVCVVVGSRAQAAGVTRALNAIHQAGSRVVGGVERIAFTTAWNERKADGLALGIGAIVLLDRCVCVFETGVCDVSNSLRATGAVIGKSEVGDGSNSAEKILLRQHR